MKLSHKHKFLFIAIPKTGTTSVGNGLEKYGHPTTHWMPNRNHVSAGFLKNYYELNNPLRKEKFLWDDYFKFTFVRNPWDRLVSVFHFLNPNYKSKDIVAPKTRSRLYNRFIKKYKGNFKHFACDVDVNRILHSKPQYLFMCDDTDNLIVDFIGKIENLQEDFNVVCDKIGIPRQKLPHKNKSKHKHYTEYYDDETRQIVAEKYAKDIGQFGYEFGE